MAVIFKVLFSVQSTAATAAAGRLFFLDTRGFFTRTKPLLTDLLAGENTLGQIVQTIERRWVAQ